MSSSCHRKDRCYKTLTWPPFPSGQPCDWPYINSIRPGGKRVTEKFSSKQSERAKGSAPLCIFKDGSCIWRKVFFMNRQAEKIKNLFSPCHISDALSPLEPCHRHTTPHENRFYQISHSKDTAGSAMQNYNNTIWFWYFSNRGNCDIFFHGKWQSFRNSNITEKDDV